MAAACILIVLRVWISPLPSSFWIDETGTVWAIRGSFQDLLHRLHNYLFPQMPLFTMVMWGWSRIAGLGEVALRIPSVVASLGSAALLYRLGKKLLGRTGGLYTAIVFMTLSHAGFAAADARPYAFAILALICALYARVKFTETGKIRYAVGYGLGCGACGNLVYFFVMAIAADLVYMLVAHLVRRSPLRRGLLLSYAIAGVLMLPLVPGLLVITKQSAIHIVAAGMPSWTDLGVTMIPPRWIVAAVFGSAAAWVFAGRRISLRFSGHGQGAMLLCWAFLPSILLFGYSLGSRHSVFLPRYLLAGAPGAALLGGYMLTALHPAVWRVCIALILTGMSIFTQGSKLWTDHHEEDWRGASAAIARIRNQEPGRRVLAASSYVESAHLPMPPPAGDSYDFLLTNFDAYPIPGTAVPLPVDMTVENLPYVKAMLDNAAQASSFILLFPAASPLVPWVLGRLDGQFAVTFVHANPVVMDVRKR